MQIFAKWWTQDLSTWSNFTQEESKELLPAVSPNGFGGLAVSPMIMLDGVVLFLLGCMVVTTILVYGLVVVVVVVVIVVVVRALVDTVELGTTLPSSSPPSSPPVGPQSINPGTVVVLLSWDLSWPSPLHLPPRPYQKCARVWVSFPPRKREGPTPWWKSVSTGILYKEGLCERSLCAFDPWTPAAYPLCLTAAPGAGLSATRGPGPARGACREGPKWPRGRPYIERDLERSLGAGPWVTGLQKVNSMVRCIMASRIQAWRPGEPPDLKADIGLQGKRHIFCYHLSSATRVTLTGEPIKMAINGL